jgi:hypothetical protein
MLSYFRELVKTYSVFKMKPAVVGGYGERYDIRNVTGYWSWRKQSKFDEQGGTRSLNYAATFCAVCSVGEAAVRQNDCVEVNGKIFRAMDDQDFSIEGGFIKVLMERFVGVTGQQVTNKKVDEVIKNDY